MDFVKLSEQRFTAKKFDVNKKIPRDDVEKLKTILQLSPSSVNSQPWVFLWGTSDNSKKRVRPAIADFNWNRIDTCSDFVVIAVRKGLDDKFQHTLLDQEIKDGRIANEEIADMHSASLHFERLAKGGVRAELMIDRLATKDPEKNNE